MGSLVIKSTLQELRFHQLPVDGMVNPEKVRTLVRQHGDGKNGELKSTINIVLQVEVEKQRQANNSLKKNWKYFITA
jgi:hypothetical protein